MARQTNWTASLRQFNKKYIAASSDLFHGEIINQLPRTNIDYNLYPEVILNLCKINV